MERDERLTRTVDFRRAAARGRSALTVREAALAAVVSTLRVQVLAGGDFAPAAPARVEATAARPRGDWARDRGLTVEERVRRVLTDEGSNQERLREAAQVLAEQRGLGATLRGTASGESGAPNPALDPAEDTQRLRREGERKGGEVVPASPPAATSAAWRMSCCSFGASVASGGGGQEQRQPAGQPLHQLGLVAVSGQTQDLAAGAA